ncbi:MAG: S8 family serine peptidase [Lachnospiraceae bacterium]|nr:S8 family serine peptidase [Lachnospiraceae bacterium]
MVYDPAKLGTELNLSLSIPQEERNNSLDLDVGYNSSVDEWQLIIRYTGDLEEVSKSVGFSYTILQNNYAIIRIKSENIELLTRIPSILFIEKPKSIYLEVAATSILKMDGLSGKGVVTAVIDSGIDYKSGAFINNDGTTKLVGIWDQTLPYDEEHPNQYGVGRFFTREEINTALKTGDGLPTYDYSGHGTGVASIISRDVPDSDILAIKLDNSNISGFPNTISLILALDYAVSFSQKYDLPMVINLSFGNNYGDHGSNSMLEEYIDSVADTARISIVTGMGNEGRSARHAQIMLGNTAWQYVDFQVNPYEIGINLQIWRDFVDVVDIFLTTPSGVVLGPFNLYSEVMSYSLPDMDISVINGYPTPYNKNQETYISISPKNEYIEQGIWTVSFNPKSILNGRVDLWLPVSEGTSSDVRFITPSRYTTMTIPASARSVISVGAYDERLLSYASFSGRGYAIDNQVKPDVSAPGVNIQVASPGGGYVTVSGTSFATPYVSARAAKLMEWGIVKGNDPFMYGEKLKANLIREAGPLPGYKTYPNPEIGWGAL